jgi:hypothetical protein
LIKAFKQTAEFRLLLSETALTEKVQTYFGVVNSLKQSAQSNFDHNHDGVVNRQDLAVFYRLNDLLNRQLR